MGTTDTLAIAGAALVVFLVWNSTKQQKVKVETMTTEQRLLKACQEAGGGKACVAGALGSHAVTSLAGNRDVHNALNSKWVRYSPVGAVGTGVKKLMGLF